MFYQEFFFIPKSMKRCATLMLVFAFLFAALPSDGQFFEFAGSRGQALANASAGLTGSWSVFGNQAGLAGISRPEVAVAIQNRFLVRELSDRVALFTFPVQSSNIAFSFYQFGELPFRQEKIGLAYARHVSPKISFGLQFSYFRFYLPEANRSAGSAGLELGVQYLADPKLKLGLHITNPYQTSVKTYSGELKYPSGINLGFQYQVSEAFLWAFDVETQPEYRFRIKTGMEYGFRDKLFLRLGVASHPYLLSSGIGFRLRRLMVDLGNSFHANLGNSPSVSLTYSLGK